MLSFHFAESTWQPTAAQNQWTEHHPWRWRGTSRNQWCRPSTSGDLRTNFLKDQVLMHPDLLMHCEHAPLSVCSNHIMKKHSLCIVMSYKVCSHLLNNGCKWSEGCRWSYQSASSVAETAQEHKGTIWYPYQFTEIRQILFRPLWRMWWWSQILDRFLLLRVLQVILDSLCGAKCFSCALLGCWVEGHGWGQWQTRTKEETGTNWWTLSDSS